MYSMKPHIPTCEADLHVVHLANLNEVLVTHCWVNIIRRLFKKYPTFGREKYIYTPGGLQL
jgi:hypothetical protein